jgi:hypothetical protein
LLVHTVTKVLVVFAAVLCVLLAALTMAYSVNVDRIAGSHRAAVDARLQAETLASTKVGQAVEEQSRLKQEISDLNSKLTATATSIAALETERTQLIGQVAQALASRDAIANQTAQGLATANTLAEINKAYAEEVTRLRDTELARSKREIELVDRINDLESQNEVQIASVRALQEQLAEARRTIESGGIASTDRRSTSTFRPTADIRGKVVSTTPDPATGQPMATINVGSNDNVRENMVLSIVRNGKFVADFVVTKTDLQWSIGRIDALGNKSVQIQPGDIVTTLAGR